MKKESISIWPKVKDKETVAHVSCDEFVVSYVSLDWFESKNNG